MDTQYLLSLAAAVISIAAVVHMLLTFLKSMQREDADINSDPIIKLYVSVAKAMVIAIPYFGVASVLAFLSNAL